MKCSRCGYFNLPGAEVCGRCGSSLAAVPPRATPAAFEEVYPPRARNRTLKTRVRAQAQQAVGRAGLSAQADRAQTGLTTQTGRVRAALNSAYGAPADLDWRPWMIASCAVVPGLVQAFQGRTARAVYLLAATALLLCGVFVSIRLPLADVMLWGLFALSTYSVWEVVDQVFPGWIATNRSALEAQHLRAFRLLLLAIVIVALTVVGVMSVAGRWYSLWIFRTTQAMPVFQAGDGVIVRHVEASRRNLLQRGEVILYAVPAGFAQGVYFEGEGIQAERVLGLPGDHLETRGGAFFLNGKPLAANHQPLNVPGPVPTLQIDVPKDRFLVWRGFRVEGRGENAPRVASYLLVTAEDIHGRAVAIYQPPARRRWFK